MVIKYSTTITINQQNSKFFAFPESSQYPIPDNKTVSHPQFICDPQNQVNFLALVESKI